MNKSEMVSALAGATNITKSKASECVDALFGSTGVITESLREGEPVVLTGFGTFSVTHRKARTGRNPRTGEELEIAAKNSPRFKPGKTLRSRVNE